MMYTQAIFANQATVDCYTDTLELNTGRLVFPVAKRDLKLWSYKDERLPFLEGWVRSLLLLGMHQPNARRLNNLR